jgi:Mrp family chromosome partitioning ATPase
MDSRAGTHPQTLADYLAILRRRKWIAIQTVLIVPIAAVLLTMQEPKEYAAQAEVLLQRQTISSALGGPAEDANAFDPDRYASTQAELARIPEVASGVVARVNNQRTAGELLAMSSIFPKAGSDILVIQVNDRDPNMAARLATAYAREFTKFQGEFATARYRRAIADLDAEIARMRKAGQSEDSTLMRSLFESKNELRRLETLTGGSGLVTKTPDAGYQVAPKPKRNGLLGLMFGLALGLGSAFIWEALDRRVRSDDEVERVLGLPLLARIPEPPREIRRRDGLVMISEPGKVHAEAFRRLRTNIEFANLEASAKTIMVTSSVECEGKSTTIANLAVAFARAGRHVALVDLDLRKPYLDRFFKIQRRPGVAEVAVGQVALEEALVRIAIPAAGSSATSLIQGMTGGNGSTSTAGVLEVLPAGATPPNAGEFVASKAVAEILADLSERADIVLVDAPPLLVVGDAVALSARIDALLVVVRMNVVRRPMLREVRRFLDASPAATLGFVDAGGKEDDVYGYGGYYQTPSRPETTERERV